MEIVTSPLLAALAIGALLPPAWSAIGAWRRRETPGASALALMMAAAFCWSAAYAAALAAPDVPTRGFWVQAQFLAATVVPAAWLQFALRYDGRAGWLGPGRRALLWAGPALAVLLLATNPAHHLVYRGFALGPDGAWVVERGPALWAYVALGYLYMLAGMVVLGSMLLRSPRAYRAQAAVLIPAAAAPWVANALHLSAVLPPGVDPTPFGFGVMGGLLSLGLLRFRLLATCVGLVPAARDAIVDGMRDGILVLDGRRQVVDANPAAERLLGIPPGAALGRALADEAPELARAVAASADLPEVHAEIVRERLGLRRHLDVQITPLGGRADGAGRLVVLRDVTERKLVEAALRESEGRYRSVVNTLSEVVFQTDAAGRWALLNPAWTAITGFVVAESIGTWPVTYVHADDREAFAEQLGRLMEGAREAARFEVRFRTSAGGVRWLEVHARPLVGAAGRVAGTIGTLNDVTERRVLEEQLAHQAFHDPLTGLANRALFLERVAHALAVARRSTTGLAVLFLDLDNFKTVNDSLGHAAGDELLVAVAGRLAGCVRGTDTVARLGGDEFAILLEVVARDDQPAATAGRVLDALRTPFSVAGTEVFVGASVGIAPGGPGTIDADTLLRNADIAMYTAKREGRNRAVRFEPGMDRATRERLALEADLHRAVERDELVVLYQPTVCLGSGRTASLEALVRWRHPERGLVPPSEFIPVAEETGLILPIGRWVLKEACRRAARWGREVAAARGVGVAVNLSARQFQDPALLAVVAEALAESGLEPDRLTLEITESVVMQDTQATVAKLGGLKALGVQLAIDDFGTGYSSLSYLQRFPIDVLKIDRAFVSGLTKSEDAAVLTRTIVQMAQTLRLRAVAEGIEDGDQLERLRALGCDLGQGYHFARPLPSEALDAFLGARPSVSAEAVGAGRGAAA
jgi:diguanylate cyclase (GGDEF)-like protein/PAS domain S-box-containing protein